MTDGYHAEARAADGVRGIIRAWARWRSQSESALGRPSAKVNASIGAEWNTWSSSRARVKATFSMPWTRAWSLIRAKNGRTRHDPGVVRQ